MAAMSYMMLFAVPFGAISATLVKRIGAASIVDRHSFFELLEQWMFVFVKKHALILAVVALFVSIILFLKSGLVVPSVVFVLVMTVLNIMTVLYFATLQAYKKFIAFGGISLAAALVKIFGALVIIRVFPTLTNLYLIFVTATFLSYVLSQRLVKKIGKIETKIKHIEHTLLHPLSYFKKKSVLIPFLATIGMVGMLQVDVIMVKQFFSPEDVGLYAGLSLLGKIILYVSAPLSTVAFIFFTGSESKKNRESILLLTSLLFIIIGALAFGFYRFFPEVIISIIFGEKFLPIAELVQLSAIFGIFYSLANLFAQYFIAKDHWLGLASLVAVIFQILGITLFHQSFQQVLQVSIGVTVLLLLFYVGLTFKSLIQVRVEK